MHRYALTLAYDGSRHRGWWRQTDGGGVADRLDAACRRFGEPGGAVGASRTDAGVHALGQVAHLDCVRERDPAILPRCLNRHLPGDVACLAAARVDAAWHAVHRAVAKTYRYRLHVGRTPDPFVHRRAWHRPGPTAGPLAEAAGLLTGTHDFRAFRRRGDHRDDCTCTLEEIGWREEGDELVCTVTGDRFIQRLVRSLVGVMVACATGQVALDQLAAALEGELNPASRHQAPARGLWLAAVRYAPPPPWTPPA